MKIIYEPHYLTVGDYLFKPSILNFSPAPKQELWV